MELLLNAIWLMVSAVPIAWWISNRSFASPRRKFYLGIGALLCVGMLIFPPISISDDLHQDLFAAEDANSAKKVVAGVAHANGSSPCVLLPFAAVAAIVGTFHPSPSSLVPSFTPVLDSSLFVKIVPSRAPPAA